MAEAGSLVIVNGQEGAGKSTVIRALLRHTPQGAQVDGEDVGQVHPWVFDEAFGELHRRNVAALVRNFWAAGYLNVISGSFLRHYGDYRLFRPMLPNDTVVHVVQLCATKRVRDARRIARPKPSDQQSRDHVDRVSPEDHTFRDACATADYRFLRIENSLLTVAETVARIKEWLPGIYGA